MRRAGILLLIMVITSCTGQLPAVKEEIIGEKRGKPQLLMSKLTSYNEKVSDLRASALLVYRDKGRTLSFRSDLLAHNHLESIRLDIYDLVFKTPFISMVKRGNDIFAVIYIKKEYFSSTIDEVDFKRLLGFDVPVQLLFHSLLAKVYIPDQEYEEKEVDDYHLEFESPKLKQIVTFNEDFVPVDIQYTVKDDVYYVKFENQSQVGNVEFPLRITIRNRGRVLEFNYSNVDLDAEISQETFLLEDSVTEGFIRVD